jgi:plastocyanin
VLTGICVTAAALPAQQLATAPVSTSGRVEGTVVLSARLLSRKPRVRIESAYGGSDARPPVNELMNVVLFIDSITPPAGWTPTAPADGLAIRQRHEAFVPHVLPVRVGATVAFPNEDPFFHNVFSLSRARTFDLGRYPTGSSKSVRFDKAGIVQVFCHIHSDMRATVYVLSHAFFTTPDSAGRFALPPLPPGTYTLVAWHERIRPIERRIHVRAGATTTVDIAIPLPPPTDTSTP